MPLLLYSYELEYHNAVTPSLSVCVYVCLLFSPECLNLSAIRSLISSLSHAMVDVIFRSGWRLCQKVLDDIVFLCRANSRR